MQHTRTQACYFISGASLSLGAAGWATGALRGGPWDGVWEALADPPPWGPGAPPSAAGVPSRRFFWAPLGGGQGRDLVSQHTWRDNPCGALLDAWPCEESVVNVLFMAPS